MFVCFVLLVFVHKTVVEYKASTPALPPGATGRVEPMAATG